MAPASNGSATVTWTADIGPGAAVGEIAEHLADLQTLIGLGSRWGLRLAEDAAVRSFRSGKFDPASAPEGLTEEPGSLRGGGVGPQVGGQHIYQLPSLGGVVPSGLSAEAVQLVTADRIPALLGSELRVEEASYSNPLELLLFGAGFLFVGATSAMRFIRDWHDRKKIEKAAARLADAAALQGEALAELTAWTVREIKEGRLHIPPAELTRLVTPPDLAAMARLAGREIQLSLPAQAAG